MSTTTVCKGKNYIDGEWEESESGKTFVSVNPADTTETVGIFPASTAEDARRAISAAENAFDSWRETSPSQRAAVLHKAADILESRLDQLAWELTREEGKLLAASRAEVMRSAKTLRYYAVEGLNVTGETFPNDDPQMMVYTAKEPLGVVTVITPWNFPLSIPARKIAPALVTGNTVVFKPSSDTPLIGFRLVEALHEAGIPKGVINLVTGSSSRLGKPLAADPAIRAISFTGSTAAGEAIHRLTSLTTRIQMELGGKNPIIVLDDADIDLAAELTVKGAFSLTGQACTGTSRAIVMESVKEAYLDKLIEKTKKLVIGNGLTHGVDMTPVANQKQLSNILAYLRIGQEEGADLVYGGGQLLGGIYERGYYIRPAIFDRVTPEMRIAQEEIFGPVISVLSVGSYEEAINVANHVEYGLSASIVTQNIQMAHQFAKDIQAGTVKVNRPTTGNLINAPFGGIKKSSTSTFRESGQAGLDFFTQIKTVYVGS